MNHPERIIAFLLAVMMVFSLIACGAPAESAETVSSEGTSSGDEILTNYEVVIDSDKVPNIILDGDYKRGSLPTEDDTFETLGYYLSVSDPNMLAVGFYKYPNNGQTLMEVAQATIAYDVQEEQAKELHPIEYKGWQNPSDGYEYVYYMYYEPEYYGEPMYVQAFLFEDGADVYEINFIIKTQKIEIEGTDLSIRLPAHMQEDTEPSQQQIDEGFVFSYLNNAKLIPEFSCLDVYVFDANGSTIEDVEKYCKENYEACEGGLYDLPQEDGSTVKCCYLEFMDSDEDGTYYNEEYIAPLPDGRFIGFDFWQTERAEDDEPELAFYMKVSSFAFIWSVE